MTKNVTVLIADDDPLIRSVLKMALERSGYRTAVAHDGAQAVAAVEAGGVDIVLLDILMPRKEGLETLLDIKRRFPEIKVYAMSSSGKNSRADFLSVAAKFGADATLRKPFAPRVLLNLIEGGERLPQQSLS